ncbi:RtcB family protein [Succinimonas amylolytica]|uniref:RtcB family protein n=1 Tax=Succinimonas amylolytica TaxID=83769 RepID=UPI0023A8CAF3
MGTVLWLVLLSGIPRRLTGGYPADKNGEDHMIIEGRINSAVCYASVIEDEAIRQIKRMCDYDLTSGSRIRIMPDVHAGKGCTIGTTMTVTDRAVPNIVGVDIGCGMYTVNLGKADIDFKRLDAAAHRVPSGMQVWDREQESFSLEDLRCCGLLTNTDRLRRSLGTLGGGNHFIEADVSRDGTKYLVIHSGSRNLGKQVADIYQRAAVRQCRGDNGLFQKKMQLVAELKGQGRSREIGEALKALEHDHCAEPDIPEDLCYLQGAEFENYLHDVEICQRFARRNREIMAAAILDYAGLQSYDSFHTIHNYIDTREMILRKGAIAAHEGERVLIPVNMRDGSILATGRGNPEWNYSAPHGAGRIMSRTAARKKLSLEEYRKAMSGVYSTSVNEETLDEAPMAYKSLGDITGYATETIDIVEVLRPVYNFKAAESAVIRK